MRKPQDFTGRLLVFILLFSLVGPWLMVPARADTQTISTAASLMSAVANLEEYVDATLIIDNALGPIAISETLSLKKNRRLTLQALHPSKPALTPAESLTGELISITKDAILTLQDIMIDAADHTAIKIRGVISLEPGTTIEGSPLSESDCPLIVHAGKKLDIKADVRLGSDGQNGLYIETGEFELQQPLGSEGWLTLCGVEGPVAGKLLGRLTYGADRNLERITYLPDDFALSLLENGSVVLADLPDEPPPQPEIHIDHSYKQGQPGDLIIRLQNITEAPESLSIGGALLPFSWDAEASILTVATGDLSDLTPGEHPVELVLHTGSTTLTATLAVEEADPPPPQPEIHIDHSYKQGQPENLIIRLENVAEAPESLSIGGDLLPFSWDAEASILTVATGDLSDLTPGEHPVELVLHTGSATLTATLVVEEADPPPPQPEIHIDHSYKQGQPGDLIIRLENVAEAPESLSIGGALLPFSWDAEAGRLTVATGDLSELTPGEHTVAIVLHTGSTTLTATLAVEEADPPPPQPEIHIDHSYKQGQPGDLIIRLQNITEAPESLSIGGALLPFSWDAEAGRLTVATGDLSELTPGEHTVAIVLHTGSATLTATLVVEEADPPPPQPEIHIDHSYKQGQPGDLIIRLQNITEAPESLSIGGALLPFSWDAEAGRLTVATGDLSDLTPGEHPVAIVLYTGSATLTATLVVEEADPPPPQPEIHIDHSYKQGQPGDLIIRLENVAEAPESLSIGGALLPFSWDAEAGRLTVATGDLSDLTPGEHPVAIVLHTGSATLTATLVVEEADPPPPQPEIHIDHSYKQGQPENLVIRLENVAEAPESLSIGGALLPFSWDAEAGILTVAVERMQYLNLDPGSHAVTLVIGPGHPVLTATLVVEVIELPQLPPDEDPADPDHKDEDKDKDKENGGGQPGGSDEHSGSYRPGGGGGGGSVSREKTTAIRTPAAPVDSPSIPLSHTAAQAAYTAAKAQAMGRNLALRLKGVGEVSAEVVESLSRQATAEGYSGHLLLDTLTASGAVGVRLYLPFPLAGAFNAGGRVEGAAVEKVAQTFGRWFNNPLQVMRLEQKGSFGQRVRVAALMGSGALSEPWIYRYDEAANTYRLLQDADAYISGSYVYLTVEQGGCFILSDGPLVRK